MIAATGLRSAPPPSPAATVAVIDLKAVTKVYAGRDGGSVRALGPVDLRIEPGSFVSVVGPSGCGKSTLLRLVAGLELPDQGTVQRYGSPLDGPSREVSIVFQEHVLLPWITVLENVLLPADVLWLPKAASRQRAMRLWEMTGLKDFADLRPQMLSGGMKQRAAFCRAMLSDPRLLLLDEPFGALDALTREELSLELSRLWQDLGRSALLITHQIEEAILLGGRILLLSERPRTIRAQIHVGLAGPRHAGTLKFPPFLGGKQCAPRMPL